jgi:hypothetical protein
MCMMQTCSQPDSMPRVLGRRTPASGCGDMPTGVGAISAQYRHCLEAQLHDRALSCLAVAAPTQTPMRIEMRTSSLQHNGLSQAEATMDPEASRDC